MRAAGRPRISLVAAHYQDELRTFNAQHPTSNSKSILGVRDLSVRAEVVKLHFFVGLTPAETAEVLRLSEKGVRRHWNIARVWLYRAIRESAL